MGSFPATALCERYHHGDLCEHAMDLSPHAWLLHPFGNDRLG